MIGKLAEELSYHQGQFDFAAHHMPPDMHDFIRHSPMLMTKIRQAMIQQGIIAKS